MYNIKFVEKEVILSSGSSEWVRLGFPITTHLFEDKFEYRYKRIETKDGVKWRKSHTVGEWLSVPVSFRNIVNPLHSRELP